MRALARDAALRAVPRLRCAALPPACSQRRGARRRDVTAAAAAPRRGCVAASLRAHARARRAGLVDDVAGLSDGDLAGLLTWRDFYHKDYAYVGLLAGGAFYDASGAPRPPVAAVAAAAARVAAQRAAAAAAERAAPACNAQWSAAAGGEVWCEHGTGVPRRTVAPPPREGAAPTVRCACMAADVTAAGATSVEIYPGCRPDATRCRTTPPAGG
jgi:hypothetical protein